MIKTQLGTQDLQIKLVGMVKFLDEMMHFDGGRKSKSILLYCVKRKTLCKCLRSADSRAMRPTYRYIFAVIIVRIIIVLIIIMIIVV